MFFRPSQRWTYDQFHRGPFRRNPPPPLADSSFPPPFLTAIDFTSLRLPLYSFSIYFLLCFQLSWKFIQNKRWIFSSPLIYLFEHGEETWKFSPIFHSFKELLTFPFAFYVFFLLWIFSKPQNDATFQNNTEKMILEFSKSVPKYHPTQTESEKFFGGNLWEEKRGLGK